MPESNLTDHVQTYEQTTALQSVLSTPDPIHYNPSYSFRNSPYRHLHHQNGSIGTFTVRLVEAKNLKRDRSNWSVLGMGPVKLLGLSNACGEVSSCAVFRLAFRERMANSRYGGEDYNHSCVGSFGTVEGFGGNATWENDSIASAVSNSTTASGYASISPSPSNGAAPKRANTVYSKQYKSTSIPSNSNPKWNNVQSDTNKSLFAMRIDKGIMPHDGMEIYLQVQMQEERTRADAILPVKGGDGVLGVGEINLTSFVLRTTAGNGSANDAGGEGKEQEFVDVWDEWIELVHPQSQSSEDNEDSQDQKQRSDKIDDGSSDEGDRGRVEKVRLLISYEPNGLTPRRGDVVALESFARRPVSIPSLSKSRPIIPPLHPLRVKDVKDQYLLCTYDLNLTMYEHGSNSGSNHHHHHHHRDGTSNDSKKAKAQTGSIRLHRNSVFVIERTNVIDSAVDVALKPADVVMSTSIGKDVSVTLAPYVESAGELLMPAVLSAKLLFEAAKVGGSAFAVGLKSAASAVAESQDPEKRRRSRRKSFDD